MNLIDESQKPDLRHESLLFSAVKNVSVGAAAGAALTLAVSQAAHFKGFKESAGVKGPVEFISKHIGRAAAGWGVINGVLGLSTTIGHNETKNTVRPYVEKLENERAVLASTVNGLTKG